MFRGKSLTREILFMAITGPIVLSSLFLPNASQMLKPLVKWQKNWGKVDRRRIYEAIGRLNKKRLINLIEKGNDTYIEITENEKKLIKQFDYENIELPKNKKWDKKWRLVVFDIPEKNKKERFAFSEKLKTLGFYPLQKSVFIYPYDCRNEIDFICNFMSIDRYVNYCIIEFLGKREGDLRYIFGLKFS